MIAWVDASVGAAGDMLLAALIDAGASLDGVREGLGRLGLDGWSLDVEEVRRGAFRALRAHVRADIPHHPHRPWAEVRALLSTAELPERARRRALAAYRRLAEAEAHLHGVPVDEVELHEVGAIDSIIDMVGVCLALELLGVSQVVATPLPMGTGHVHSAHGDLPLPAPATLEVVKGWPVVTAARPGEWVTPTAAALLTSLGTPGPFPGMVPLATGHGAGSRDPEGMSNIVRVVVGAPHDAPGAATVMVELAANIDDMPPELVPSAIEACLRAGAADAWATPIVMKKGRPALQVGALAEAPVAAAVADAMLRHTTTLGVRTHTVHRAVLDRRLETVNTPWGEVRVKVAGRGDEVWHVAPEYDDVRAVATRAAVPLLVVYQAALGAWRDA